MLHIGAHTKTEAAFNDLLVEIGLATKDAKTQEYHTARNTPQAGFQVSGPLRIPNTSTNLDKDGNPTESLPGVYYNIRLWGDLEIGRKLDAWGKDEKDADVAGIEKGTIVTKGDADNTKLPSGINLTNGRIYKLDSSSIATPYNVWQ